MKPFSRGVIDTNFVISCTDSFFCNGPWIDSCVWTLSAAGGGRDGADTGGTDTGGTDTGGTDTGGTDTGGTDTGGTDTGEGKLDTSGELKVGVETVSEWRVLVEVLGRRVVVGVPRLFIKLKSTVGSGGSPTGRGSTLGGKGVVSTGSEIVLVTRTWGSGGLWELGRRVAVGRSEESALGGRVGPGGGFTGEVVIERRVESRLSGSWEDVGSFSWEDIRVTLQIGDGFGSYFPTIFQTSNRQHYGELVFGLIMFYSKISISDHFFYSCCYARCQGKQCKIRWFLKFLWIQKSS